MQPQYCRTSLIRTSTDLEIRTYFPEYVLSDVICIQNAQGDNCASFRACYIGVAPSPAGFDIARPLIAMPYTKSM